MCISLGSTVIFTKSETAMLSILEGLDKPVELFGGRHVRVDLQLEGVADRKNLQ